VSSASRWVIPPGVDQLIGRAIKFAALVECIPEHPLLNPQRQSIEQIQLLVRRFDLDERFAVGSPNELQVDAVLGLVPSLPKFHHHQDVRDVPGLHALDEGEWKSSSEFRSVRARPSSR